MSDVCHAGIEFLCNELGYTIPKPVEPRDEVADLLRAFNESVAQQKALADRIEKAALRGNPMLRRSSRNTNGKGMEP